MKDKNGVEIRVGDELSRQRDGEHFRVTKVSDVELKVDFNGNKDCITAKKLGILGGTWEVIRRADGSDPREVDLKGNPVKSDGGHWWDEMDICQDCGMAANHYEDTGFSCTGRAEPSHPPQPSAKSPAELYADFHRIVTETVEREAPKVTVVTDFGPRFCDAGVGMLWLKLGEFSEEGFCPLRGNDASYVADVLYLLGNLREKANPLR